MLNTILFMGRLTTDPKAKEVKKGEEAHKVSEFSLANNTKIAGKEVTTFLNCYAWDSLVDPLVKFKKKGDVILIQGELRQRRYEDKNGNKQMVYEVVCRSIEFDVGAPKKGEDDKPEAVDLDIPC